MTIVFGRIGRAFLLAGAAALVLAVLAWLLLPDGGITALVLGILAVVGLIQGAVWTVVQQRMFGSIAALRRVETSGRPTRAAIVGVQSTSSRIGAEPIARLDLRIDGTVVRRHVRIPFTHTSVIRTGLDLPVLTDPQGSRALVVQWDRLG
ncbi:hypothetical protein [Pseudonocardia pini]|uniref:hypothetical protein n=1 Tax=Pseudonocardia pini TaxID=2758030 RepID=UPI0015F0EB12|nr:hypothetical protein [Pseudonocardia pini]